MRRAALTRWWTSAVRCPRTENVTPTTRASPGTDTAATAATAANCADRELRWPAHGASRAPPGTRRAPAQSAKPRPALYAAVRVLGRATLSVQGYAAAGYKAA